MLSAVENFGGPLVGPAVALSHHHPHAVHHLQAQHHQHINTTAQHERGGVGYALDIIGAEGSVRVSAAAPTSATSVPTSSAGIISAQVPLTPNQLTQLNALQALKLQQLQQQYEQQLSNFLSASSVATQSSTAIAGGVAVPLPHRPQPQVAATLSEEQQQQQQQQHHYNLQHQYQQQQEHQQQQQLQREQQSNSVNLTLPPTNAPKYMSSPRDTSAMMPLTEFTQPPKPKHEQQRTAKENVQCGAMNLVTSSSNTFPSSTNPYQLNSASSSNSNPASIDNSRPSSTSSSVDVENDESMSPVSTNGRKLFDPAALLPGNATLKQPTYSETSASSAAAAVVAAYQYNYAHLYGAGAGGGGGRPVAGLYNAPVIFAAAAAHNQHVPHVIQHPSAVHGPASPAAYLNALATHTAAISPTESGVYSAEYFKALQNAVAAGVFQAVPPTHTTPVFPISPLANSGSSSNSTPPATISMPKTRQRCAATGSMPTQAPIASPPAKCEQRNATTTKLSTGTYLYEKAKRSPPDTPSDTEKFFKIPSGKEGSLKHRILTRPPSADKTPAATAVTTASTAPSMDSGKTPVMRTHNSTSSFKKGSYIELSNGSLRRVEDMRTEDFIQCAERSQNHQLIESTVVKINTSPTSSSVVIAFSYDRNQSKVDMEVATEYPFFVYGQGWASCNPELSYKAFGLKCQRLQVGDICISLTKREPPNIHINNNNNNITSSNNNNNNNNNNKPTYIHDPTATTTTTTATTTPITTNETHGAERDLQPLILSESVYATHLKSAGMCPPPTTAQYQLLRSPHGGTVHFMPPPPTHLLANTPPTPEAYAHFVFPTPPQQQQQHHHHHTQVSSTTTVLHNTRMQHSSDLTSTPTMMNNSSTRPMADACEQSAAATASARKRRWSAPESFSNSEDDDDEDTHAAAATAAADYQPPPVRQKSAPTAAVSSNYKPYLPATNMRLPATGQLYCDFSTNYK